MKNGILKVIVIAMFSLTINSCSNEMEFNPAQDLEGDYKGTFTVEYSNGDTFSNPVTVSFNEGNYHSSGNEDYFPAGGNGTYEKSNSTIKFNDDNYWTANFDWNLILNGEYNYSISGNELIISAYKNDVGFYEYNLTRKNN